jgi:hypothetical protein
MPKLVKHLATGLLLLQLSGCAVLAVADVAASAAAGAAGLAVDATIGAAKIGGKVIGKTADVILGGDEQKE